MSKTVNKKKKNHEIGSAFDLLGKSYEIVKKNWQVFAIVNILGVIGAVSNAFGMEKEVAVDKNWSYQQTVNQVTANIEGLSSGQIAAVVGGGFAVLLALAAVSIFLYTMATSLEVKSAAGKKPELSELFEDGKKYFFRIIGVHILAGLMVLGGLILFIIPGIFAIGRLVMSPYHLVDKDLGMLEALKASNEQAKGRMGKVYAAIGVMILVSIGASIVGAVSLLGPLAAIALTIAFSVVLALRYQQLKKAN